MKMVLFLLTALCACAMTVAAQPQQSANFRISKSVLDASGGACTSTNFRLSSVLGQPTPIGSSSSANFALSSGFLSPAFAVSPLSPIQQLVILPQIPDVLLNWERIAGAAQYSVYRSTDPLFSPGPMTLLGSVSDTSFTDINIAGLTAVRNYYVVTAVSANGSLLSVRHGPAIGTPTRKTVPVVVNKPEPASPMGNRKRD